MIRRHRAIQSVAAFKLRIAALVRGKFIRSLSSLRKLSPWQQAWIDALCARYLEETIP
jgi:hypothetical protein